MDVATLAPLLVAAIVAGTGVWTRLGDGRWARRWRPWRHDPAREATVHVLAVLPLTVVGVSAGVLAVAGYSRPWASAQLVGILGWVALAFVPSSLVRRAPDWLRPAWARDVRRTESPR